MLFNTREIVHEWRLYWSQSSEDYSPCKLQSVSNVLNSTEKGSLHFFVVPWQRQRSVESAHFPYRRSEFLFLITLIFTHVWYDFLLQRTFFHMCTIIYSYLIKRQNRQPQYAHWADFVHYTLSVFLFLQPLQQHQQFNKRQTTHATWHHVTSVYRLKGR